MGFFEQPPPAEPPEEPPQPEWIGPPEGTLGGVVPVQLVLAATDRVLLAVTDVAVYPNGVGFSLRGFPRRSFRMTVHGRLLAANRPRRL